MEMLPDHVGRGTVGYRGRCRGCEGGGEDEEWDLHGGARAAVVLAGGVEGRVG
jgi:hypothetical protein